MEIFQSQGDNSATEKLLKKLWDLLALLFHLSVKSIGGSALPYVKHSNRQQDVKMLNMVYTMRVIS